MSSNQHTKHNRYSSEKRSSYVSPMGIAHNKYKINDSDINKYSGEKLGKNRHGLNINLSASPIKSLSKNTKKAQSKPALNTMEMSYHNKHYNFVSNHGKKQRKSYSTSKTKRSRFTKRISAPIILPNSTTHSLSSIGSATANLPNSKHSNHSNVATPYYTNPSKKSIDHSFILDDAEINKMIRSNQRAISKSCKSRSRPRAYSKTRMSEIEYNCAANNEYEYESDSTDSDDEKKKSKHDYHNTLSKYGYVEICVIAKSLQGIVIKAKPIEHRTEYKTVIIKITDRNLHNKKISNKHGKNLSVEEDIIKEKKLLMYLTANNGPKELVKFLGFFSDKYNYYLVMENGGSDFFDWIVKCHKWIRDGKLSLKQWNLYIRDLMLQICKFVKWLHTKMNVCHLDISLENMLILNNKYKSDGNGGIRLSRKMQIKICDFGLAEYFGDSFLCKKYVGKTHYKAPKVYKKKEAFDARKADVWSLGVSFFMMIIGAPPYKLPLDSDEHFPYIKKNNVMNILRRWGRDHYINKHTEILLNNMLNIHEDKRFTINDIEKHLYLTGHNGHNGHNQINALGMTIPYYKHLKIMKKRHSHKAKSSNKKTHRKKPSNPIHSNIMATYHDNGALMESPQSQPNKSQRMHHHQHHQHHHHKNRNIFQNLVMSSDDGQLFRYRKRKLTST